MKRIFLKNFDHQYQMMQNWFLVTYIACWSNEYRTVFWSCVFGTPSIFIRRTEQYLFFWLIIVLSRRMTCSSKQVATFSSSLEKTSLGIKISWWFSFFRLMQIFFSIIWWNLYWRRLPCRLLLLQHYFDPLFHYSMYVFSVFIYFGFKNHFGAVCLLMFYVFYL